MTAQEIADKVHDVYKKRVEDLRETVLDCPPGVVRVERLRGYLMCAVALGLVTAEDGEAQIAAEILKLSQGQA